MEEKEILKKSEEPEEEEEKKELTPEEKKEIQKEIDEIVEKAKELKKKADEELKLNNYEEAKTIYGEAINQIKAVRNKRFLAQPDLDKIILEVVVPSNLNLSMIDLKKSEWSNLINHTSKVLTIDKNNIKARYRRCVGYINIRNLNKAVDDYNELKKQIGDSSEIKLLEDMLNKKSVSSNEDENEFYKKMSRQLHKANKTIEYENKSDFGKKIENIKNFLFNKVLCCCFKRKRRNKLQ